MFSHGIRVNKRYINFKKVTSSMTTIMLSLVTGMGIFAPLDCRESIHPALFKLSKLLFQILESNKNAQVNHENDVRGWAM